MLEARPISFGMREALSLRIFAMRLKEEKLDRPILGNNLT